MVHPGPDSSDGCASGTDQQSKGEHLLAAAQNSTPRNGDASSSTELVGIPAGATGWSLVGRVDGCCRLKISTCVPAEVLRTINAIRAAIRTAKWTGGSIGVQIRERPEAAWWWVERVVVVRDL